jgi:hypothetical protein
MIKSMTKKKRSDYLVSLSDRSLSYFYPIFLVALEWFLRIAFQLDTQEFVGPTLAATSVGMIIPIISYRSSKALSDATGGTLPEEVTKQIKKLEEMGARVECGRSIVFRNICLMAALIFTLVWISTIVITTKKFPAINELWGISISYMLGLACYFLGFLLSEMKEFV